MKFKGRVRLPGQRRPARQEAQPRLPPADQDPDRPVLGVPADTLAAQLPELARILRALAPHAADPREYVLELDLLAVPGADRLVAELEAAAPGAAPASVDVPRLRERLRQFHAYARLGRQRLHLQRAVQDSLHLHRTVTREVSTSAVALLRALLERDGLQRLRASGLQVSAEEHRRMEIYARPIVALVDQISRQRGQQQQKTQRRNQRADAELARADAKTRLLKRILRLNSEPTLDVDLAMDTVRLYDEVYQDAPRPRKPTR